ncbi:MAG TPA: hypothetical protein VF189_06865 [Patescibacteria group bacterium]
MKEGNLFTDTIPYPKGSSIERKRKERRSTRVLLEELGAEDVRVIHLLREQTTHHLIGENQENYIVSGVIDDGIGTLSHIETVLRQRGGKSFKAQVCIIERR